MEAVARLKNCKGSPKKLRPVTDLIKGKPVEKAFNILRFNSRTASKKIEKLLMSAISNWENQHEGVRIEEAGLYIKQAYVDKGQSLKRWRPRAMGNADMYKKHRSHITIVVDNKADVEPQKEEAAEQQATEQSKS
jgi:large subunit ribosomal protein L22